MTTLMRDNQLKRVSFVSDFIIWFNFINFKLLLFFSQSRALFVNFRSLQTRFLQKNCNLQRDSIQTRIIGAEVERAEHLTTTIIAHIFFSFKQIMLSAVTGVRVRVAPKPLKQSLRHHICGPSYKASAIVNYVSRVVPDLKIPHFMTLEL